MNEHEHHELRMALGAYGLGQLAAAETAALEAHLDRCADCTAELVELTPVLASRRLPDRRRRRGRGDRDRGRAVVQRQRQPAWSRRTPRGGAVQTGQPGLEATADLVNHTWGVEVKLHAAGFDRGGRYRVSVLGVDGKRYPAGEFVGTGTKEMDCNLNSSVLREQASGFEVRDADGQVVVTSAFG